MRPAALFLATRPWSFIMTVLSSALAGALAQEAQAFEPPLFLLTLLALISAHAATNLLNDYFDVRRGVDRPGAPTARYRPHPHLYGQLGTRPLLVYCAALYALAWAVAAYLSLLRGPLILALASAGMVASAFYTMGPLQLKYRAAGELAVFLAWGPLMVSGVYFVLTGRLSAQVLFSSIPMGILVALVLMANNIRDIDYDSASGITTLPSLLGKRRALSLFFALLLLCYAWPPLGVALLNFSPLTLLPLATVGRALALLRDFRRAMPDDADPRTAALLLLFMALYILGLLLGRLLA